MSSARPPSKQQHYSLLDILREICEQDLTGSANWKIVPNDDVSSMWVMVRNRASCLPEQGWKLHVSATALSAGRVLRQALEVLRAESASFKVANSTQALLSLNSGERGLSQVGKFMTIYPTDDEQAVRLAISIDQATRGLEGPAIPSDRPLYTGSLVHYRYGGSSWRYVRDSHDNLTLAITDKDGKLIPDRRLLRYNPPDWVEDPFLKAGVAHPLPESSPLIDGRYLVITTLFESARGTVQLAVDIANRRRCVLKRARRHGVMGLDGRDACDRLKQEWYVLGKLSPDSRFPQPYELFEQAGDLYLAMEDVEGETLFEHVSTLSKQGRHPSGEQIVAWGREMAMMLCTVHGENLIYKDMKSSNVIISSAGLRLIDFDVAQNATDQETMYSSGTPGYIRPHRAEGEPPCVADDIYGLGALLYYMATGAEPSQAPRPRNLLARPIELMNPAIGTELASVISRCLEHDASARFTSMRALDTALAEIVEPSRLPLPFGAEKNEREDGDARSHYRTLARRLGDTLCKVAHHEPDDKGVSWLSSHPSAGGARTFSINTGSAGVVLALAELVASIGDEQHQATLLEGARWLIAAERPQQPLAGLYRGEASIGAALLRAGQALRDPDLIAKAVESGRKVAGLPYEWTDLFQGTAGCLRFHLLLWDETGEDEHLSAAIKAGEALLSAAEDAGQDGLQWPTKHGNSKPEEARLLGYGHGAAGIGDSLLDLYEVTHDERLLESAQGAGRWIARIAVPSLDDESGLAWPSAEGKQLGGPFWCYGATGIGRFFLHASRLGVMPEAEELAAKAARCAARGARWAGSVQCHGLAGNIEFLLDMFQATEDSAYLSEAMSLALLLEAFSGERADGFLTWASERPTVFTPDYMLGYAGIAVCLLRLSDPERLPHQLSRAGFRVGVKQKA